MATIDLNLLRIFATVVETTSFSAAAKKLGLPKSTVSRSIAKLENLVGAPLLYRTTRRVSVSASGAGLFERAAPLLASLEQTLGNLPDRNEQPSGVLRLTAPNDLGHAFLAEVGARFLARHPQIRLDVTLTIRQVDLIAEGFDLALRVAPRLADSSLVARKLTSAEMHLFAAPEYLTRRGTPRTPADLAEHDWVLFRGERAPFRLAGPGEGLVIDFPARILCDDYSFARAALCAGAGLGVLPAFLALDDIARGRLVRVMPRFGGTNASFYLVHPPSHRIPRKVIAFRDFLVDELKKQRF